MPLLNPFRGILPNPELAYEIVNGKEFYSFPLISSLFEDYVLSGKIKEDTLPSLYIYRIRKPERSFTGLWASTSVGELSNGNILKHEKIHADRSLWVEEMFRDKRIDFNPILLTYFPDSELDRWISDFQKSDPIISIREEEEDSLHEIWRISDFETLRWIRERFEKIKPVYLADGHHRAQAFQNWSDQESKLNSKNPQKISGFTSIYFSLNQVDIKAYHRVFTLFDSNQIDQVMKNIQEYFDLEKSEEMEIPHKKGDFFMINFRKEMYKMNPKKDFKEKYIHIHSRSSVLEIKNHLDVSVFQDHVLSDCMGLGTSHSLGELNYLGGRHSEQSIKEKVYQGEYSFGFLLAPPEFDEIRAISEAGLFMPQKSTYFEPKIPSGLVIQKL